MKFRIWLNFITLGALVVLLFFARADILKVFHNLEHLNLWVLALMIPVQFLCFLAIGKLYQAYLDGSRAPHVPLKALISLAMEVNFVLHVFPSAGVSAVSYAGVRMKEYNITPARATMLQLIRTSFAFITFIPLLLVGVLMLSFENHANNLIIFAASSLATLITLLTLLMMYIIGSKRRIHTAALLIVRTINKTVHFFKKQRPETISVESVDAALTEFHEHYLEIRHNFTQMKPVFGWAFVSNLCELLLIYVVFMAHGAFINPGALIIAYAVANLAGLVAFLPGGVGIYEPLMAGVLVSGGVTASIALSAILVYRIIAMLLSLPTGYFLYHRALKRYGTDSFKRQ